MKKLEKGSLVVGGIGFVGMGAGIGLALGGITETCCIGAITASVPGLVYLASAAVASAAMLAFVLSWIHTERRRHAKPREKEYYALNAGIIAASLGAYAIAYYCLAGIVEQAFAAGGLAAVGAAVCLGVFRASHGGDPRKKQWHLGKSVAWTGICSIGIGVVATVAVAASSALPLLLEAGIATEMIMAAQWLTVLVITMPAYTCMDSIMRALQNAKVPGFRNQDYCEVGEVFY